MQYLHSKGIVYGNLKPASILIDDEGRMKLSDCSLSAYVNTDNVLAKNHRNKVTPSYWAPELFRVRLRCSFFDLSGRWGHELCVRYVGSWLRDV
jgi:serine/threonine protein kinase